jgi:hypothetical protein
MNDFALYHANISLNRNFLVIYFKNIADKTLSCCKEWLDIEKHMQCAYYPTTLHHFPTGGA